VSLAPSVRAKLLGRYRLHVMNAPARAALLSVTERVYEEGGRLLVWSPGSPPQELVPHGNDRFATREDPGITFDFGADSTASIALGAGNAKDRAASDTARAPASESHDASEEIGWLTLRMWNQPGFVLTGGRISGP
jgi:hypothetical protein